jgi:hypothetical protein
MRMTPPDPEAPAGPFEEIASGARPIEGVGTAVAAFVGLAEAGPIDVPLLLSDWSAVEREFGGLSGGSPLARAVHDYFENGGRSAVVVRVGAFGAEAEWQGLAALESLPDVNLLVLPDVAAPGTRMPAEAARAVVSEAAAFCERHRAMLLLDAPADWTGVDAIEAAAASDDGLAGALGTDSANAAVYFPRVRTADPLGGAPVAVGAAGAVAGVIARTDATRGVWAAPAGTDAAIRGAAGLDVSLKDDELDRVNRLGVNCLRELPGGSTVVWGARTLQGADAAGSEWKYVPVRRFVLFLEESIDRGLRWAVFEPNAEPLWQSVRRDVTAFLHGLWRDGAFPGRTPDEAFFVRCGEDTMTQNDLDNGRLVVEIGIAPVRPAEFVILRIRSHAKPADDD